MSQLTKKALAESLKKLLNYTTLDKITIKDITDDCGVNRNTFYYHFKDIYDLLEFLFITEAQKLIDARSITDTWQQASINLTSYLLQNKKMINHVYTSINRDQLERYLYNVTDDILLAFVMLQADELEKTGYKVAKEDIRFVTNFHKYALVGMLFDWIRNDMIDNVEDIIAKFALITEGHALIYLKKFTEEKFKKEEKYKKEEKK